MYAFRARTLKIVTAAKEAANEKDSIEEVGSSADDRESDSDFVPPAVSENDEEYPQFDFEPEEPKNPPVTTQHKTVVNKKRKRKHNCVYCDITVYNFARHLERQHSDEFEVQKLISMDKDNPERKRIIDKIRKEGDFYSGEPIPVQEKKGQYTNNCLGNQDNECNKSKILCTLLPCTYCRGYYAKNTLRRHVKRCHFNRNADTSKRSRPQAEGHTLMSDHFGPQDPLRTSGVLTSLRADEVSLVAKRDKLICEVGGKYVKSHRDKHLIIVARRYMRRLARLLIEVRNIVNDKSLQLLSILNPTRFQAIITATRTICCYDSKTKTFQSPSFALQMGTIIKKAISAAYSMEVQKNYESEFLPVLNSMKKLIEEEWALEISSEAGQNLNLNRFNKPTLMPVAEDISKMKTYLDKLILDAKTRLAQNNKNEDAYRRLIEGAYCNLLLFNKRRVGELQRILLDTYLEVQNSQPSGDFEKLLSPTEKILINKLNRIVIRGKRGRGVPVLFDKSTQEALELAVQYRNHFYENFNPYLFGICHSESCISGYHVFRKHVQLALGDANKTSALTSTKLRKHLATIAQILRMGNGDLEQLATFMGHTTKTHNEWYRVPSDIYQTAKVSKILLIAQNCSIDKYKGQSLNDIQIEEDIVETVNSNSEDEEVESKQDENVLQIENVGKNEINGETKAKVNRKKKRKHKKWTLEEKEATKEFLKKYIQEKIPPKKNEVMELVKMNPSSFKDRNWQAIKAFVWSLFAK